MKASCYIRVVFVTISGLRYYTTIPINSLNHFIIILFQNINGGNGNANSQWTTVSSLTNAPKWLQRNCGASFAVRKEIYGK